VPEATIDKNSHFLACKYNIGVSGHALRVHFPVTQAIAGKGSAHTPLWRGVAALYSPHRSDAVLA